MTGADESGAAADRAELISRLATRAAQHELRAMEREFLATVLAQAGSSRRAALLLGVTEARLSELLRWHDEQPRLTGPR